MVASQKIQAPRRKVRHIESISVRNLSLITESGKPALHDGLLKPGSPLSPLRHAGAKDLERSQSAIDLKSAASQDAAGQAESNGSLKRPTQRIRRRSTLSWVNESGTQRQRRLLDIVTRRIPSSFFSIHASHPEHESPENPKSPKCLYVSETSRHSMNPDFQFVDPKRLSGTWLGVLDSFIIRVWVQSSEGSERDSFSLLLEMDVNLSGLEWVGHSLDHYPRPFPPNTILFKFQDGFYANGAELPSTDLDPPPLSRGVTGGPSTTSSFHELMKLNNVNECIDDALRTRTTVMNDIESIIAAEKQQTAQIIGARNAPLTTKEPVDAVLETKRQIGKLQAAIDTARARLSSRRSAITGGTAAIQAAEESFDAGASAASALAASQAAAQPQVSEQIRRLAASFLEIFPITPIPGAPLHFTIGGLYLPSAATFSRSASPSGLGIVVTGSSISSISSSDGVAAPAADEDATAAALGHVVLILHLLATYLDVALPFPLYPQASTSSVFDPLTSAAQLGIPEPRRDTRARASADNSSSSTPTPNLHPTPASAPSRVFALNQRAAAVSRFAWAVYLVNKNLEELMGARGLKVVDPRATAANLKYLLEVLASDKATPMPLPAALVRAYS